MNNTKWDIVGMWIIHKIETQTLVILVQLLLGSEIFGLLHSLVEHVPGLASCLLQSFVNGGGMLLEERQDDPETKLLGNQSNKIVRLVFTWSR